MWRTVQLVHAVRYEPITGKLYMSKLANPSVCVPRLGAAAVRERNYDWEWCARPALAAAVGVRARANAPNILRSKT